jgi:hypothetical protein
LELAGLEVALAESVREWGVGMKAWDMTVNCVAFISTVHLGYSTFIIKYFSFFNNKITIA